MNYANVLLLSQIQVCIHKEKVLITDNILLVMINQVDFSHTYDANMPVPDWPGI